MSKQRIADLVAKISADPSDFNRDLTRTQARLKRFAGAARVAGLAAAAGIAVAATGMAVLSKRSLSTIDDQAKMARSIDGTVDGLRALQIAGDDAGVAQNAVGESVQKLGSFLAEADRRGMGPAKEALDALGLSAKDLMELDVDHRIALLADRMKSLNLSGQQASDMMRQFGVRNKEFSLLMIQGGDAIRAARQEVVDYGLSLDADVVAGVERANDAMTRIGFVFEGLGNRLAVNIAPILENISLRFKAIAGNGGPLNLMVESLAVSFGDLVQTLLSPSFLNAATTIGVTMAGAISGTAKALVFLIENAELAGAAMVALGAAMAFFSGPIGLAIAAVAAGVFLLSTKHDQAATSADRQREAERLLAEQLSTLDTKNGAAVASGKLLIESHINQARAAATAAKAEMELGRAELMRERQTVEARVSNQPGNQFAQDELDAVDDDIKDLEDAWAVRAAAVERLQKQLQGFTMTAYPSRGSRSDAADPVTEVITDTVKLEKELAKLANRLDPAAKKMENYQQATVLLMDALKNNLITQDQFNQYIAKLNEEMTGLPDKAISAATGIKAIKKAAADPEGKEGLDALNSSLDQFIDRIETGREAVIGLLKELTKMALKGWLSKIIGGDIFSSPLIGNNAQGTDNWRGGLTWVGEQGPELVNLKKGAQVIPNHKIGAGGGQNIFAPTINAPGATAEAVAGIRDALAEIYQTFDNKVYMALENGREGGKL